ncbi:lysophosphatidic acid receptor 6 [Synchiropus splendidus]|uniref:lysophosphatidic acid receptor 6 n=1 Tax=Synchiropus splendidus TaxID=270530 RepID=UPI00237D5864|nr:lysophosphatidic acid receptor 6 [Synchiropus splendidus]
MTRQVHAQVKMSGNNSSTFYDDSNKVSVMHVCIYAFIFLVGLVFNLTALVVFCRQSKSRSQTITYMTNLALADILLILTLPVRIYYYSGFSKLPTGLCDALGLILKANMYSSILLLTCISCDRCMAVTFPMSTRVQGWRKKAPFVCLGIWILTIGASIPIYLSQQRSRSHCFDEFPVYATQSYVVYPTLLLGFGIPFVTMLVSSWGLIRAVQKSIVAQTNLVDSKKIRRMIAASLIIFLISFLPYHVLILLLSLRKNSNPLLTAYRYSLMLACLNTVLDPIAYYFTTDTFRKNMYRDTTQRMLPLNSQS